MQRRLGELAGLVVGCDALVAWCAGLIDRGYRGEMECIVAKIFGSEAQKHAAIELFMKTHGGRSFLHGHMFGDNVHEYLAPCIYEGEGEMLAMGFFKSLVKEHGKTYFEPIGKALAAAGIKKPNPLNPAHMWALKDVAPALREMDGRAAAAAGRGGRAAEDAQGARRARRVRLRPAAADGAGDLRHDEQVPTGAGRSAMPDGGALAALPGSHHDSRHQLVRRPAARTQWSATRPT